MWFKWLFTTSGAPSFCHANSDSAVDEHRRASGLYRHLSVSGGCGPAKEEVDRGEEQEEAEEETDRHKKSTSDERRQMIAGSGSAMDLSFLHGVEMERVLEVLQRDKVLRSIEENRIRSASFLRTHSDSTAFRKRIPHCHVEVD